MNFIPGMNGVKSKQPMEDQYKNDVAGKCLTPSLSYHAACLFFQDFDIKFDHWKGDISIECHQLDSCMHLLTQGSKECMELEKELLLHQSEAAAGIKLQKDQKLMALASGGGHMKCCK